MLLLMNFQTLTLHVVRIVVDVVESISGEQPEGIQKA